MTLLETENRSIRAVARAVAEEVVADQLEAVIERALPIANVAAEAGVAARVAREVATQVAGSVGESVLEAVVPILDQRTADIAAKVAQEVFNFQVPLLREIARVAGGSKASATVIRDSQGAITSVRYGAD